MEKNLTKSLLQLACFYKHYHNFFQEFVCCIFPHYAFVYLEFCFNTSETKICTTGMYTYKSLHWLFHLAYHPHSFIMVKATWILAEPSWLPSRSSCKKYTILQAFFLALRRALWSVQANDRSWLSSNSSTNSVNWIFFLTLERPLKNYLWF